MPGIIDPVKRYNPNGEYASGKGTIYVARYTDLAAPANTGILAATTCPTTGTTTVTTGITNPAVPRVVRIKGNQASVTGNVVVTGKDQFGATKTDTIASNGTSAVDGVVAFRSITSVVIPTRGAAGDTISLGPGAAVGLDRALTEAALFGSFVDGVADSGPATVDLTNNTLAFATAANGAHDFAAWVGHTDLQH